MIQIENRAEESDHGEDDDHAAYYLIDNDDAVGIKLVPNLVDEPSESEPPQQGSEDDAAVHRHRQYDPVRHVPEYQRMSRHSLRPAHPGPSVVRPLVQSG